MKTILSSRVQRATLAGAVVCAALSGPAMAADTVAPCASASSMDMRLAALARRGFTPLRAFVLRTRMIYGLDVPTAVAQVERYRQDRASCAR